MVITSIFSIVHLTVYFFLPQGILESSIKITNEPPTGMLANLHKALDNFDQVSTSYIRQCLRF